MNMIVREHRPAGARPAELRGGIAPDPVAAVAAEELRDGPRRTSRVAGISPMAGPGAGAADSGIAA
jgi:hypothetical protein